MATVSLATGSSEWMGTIPCTPDDLVDLAEQGLVSLRCAAVEWGDKELSACTEASKGGVVAAMRRLSAELADRDVGYAEEWQERVDARLWEILEHHAGFWASRAA